MVNFRSGAKVRQDVGYSGRASPESGSNESRSLRCGRIRSDVGRTRSKSSVKFGPVWVKFARNQPESGRVRQTSVKCVPSTDRKMSRFDRNMAESDQVFGQVRLGSAHFRPRLTGLGPMLSNFGASLTRFAPNSQDVSRFVPNTGDFDRIRPVFDKLGLISSCNRHASLGPLSGGTTTTPDLPLTS